MKFSHIAFISILFLTFSCNIFSDNDPNMEDPEEEITDGEIDDNERMIMLECHENRFTTKSEVEENLIGEWEIIGHGAGWSINEPQPSGFLTITEDELFFEFKINTTEFIDTAQWEIVDTVHLGEDVFLLETTPELHKASSMVIFCENYMYRNDVPFDGHMYLYEKVN